MKASVYDVGSEYEPGNYVRVEGKWMVITEYYPITGTLTLRDLTWRERIRMFMKKRSKSLQWVFLAVVIILVLWWVIDGMLSGSPAF